MSMLLNYLSYKFVMKKKNLIDHFFLIGLEKRWLQAFNMEVVCL